MRPTRWNPGGTGRGEAGRVVRVEDEVVDHERGGRFEEVAVLRLALLGGADDPARPDLEVEGEARHRAVVRDRDRQAEGLERVGVGEVVEVGLDLALVGEVGVDLVQEVVLVGPPDDEHQRDDAGESLPGAPPAVAGLEQPPAEQAERREDRQHRGGEHRVAGDDREAGDGEDGEGAEREDRGRDPDAPSAGGGRRSRERSRPRRRPSPATAALRRAGAGRRGRGRRPGLAFERFDGFRVPVKE